MKLVFKNATWLLQTVRRRIADKARKGGVVWHLLIPFTLIQVFRLIRIEKMLELAQSRDATVELSEKDYKIIFGNKP